MDASTSRQRAQSGGRGRGQACPRLSTWNDENLERQKPYWIEDVNDTRLLDYLRKDTNLERCFQDALSFIESELGGVRGIAIDLAAGVCWTSAILSVHRRIAKVHAVDCSEHRLFRIAPLVFRQYHAAESKIERELGDLDSFHYPIGSSNLVVFCQALYMVEYPVALLQNVFKALKPDGVLLIACEHIEVGPKWYRRPYDTLRLLLRPGVTPRVGAPDLTGRYAYLDPHYRSFIREAGFDLHIQQLDYSVFKGSPVKAINYFGIKRD